MPLPIKPMLAEEADESIFDTIDRSQYFVSLKYDGLRCLIHKGVAYSRNGKPFPNPSLQKQAALSTLPENYVLDCEIFYGEGKTDDFEMSKSLAFSHVPHNKIFSRYQIAIIDLSNPLALGERGREAADVDLKAFYHGALADGYEGIVLRRKGPYHQGRSRHGELIKVVPWSSAEGRIVSVEQDKITGGAVVLEDGVRVTIPTMALKANAASLVGQLLTYNFRKPTKSGGKPRFPVWKGIRLDLD